MPQVGLDVDFAMDFEGITQALQEARECLNTLLEFCGIDTALI